MTHGGNSGAALLRATRDDGTSFVLKRITPGADWLARATHDDGRTARLHAAGAFKAMPSAIEHGVVAVERTDDAAWVAWRRGHRASGSDGGDRTAEPRHNRVQLSGHQRSRGLAPADGRRKPAS